MALGILKTLKKINSSPVKVEKFSKLIWGPSLVAQRLIDQWSKEGISYKQLFCEQEVHFEAYCRYLRPLRGQANVELASKIGMSVGDGPFAGLFYKDQKFREFGGRSKSYPFREGEDYFLRESWQLADKEEPQFGYSRNSNISSSVFRVAYSEQDQLWRVELVNGDLIEAEEIYYSGNASKLMKIWTDFPEELAKEIQSKGQGHKDRKIFLVNWVSPTQVTDLRSTLYLPQSLTHDWGHFIGEFAPFVEGVGQSFCFFFFVDEEEVEAEELTRKFQALKRVLAKVFPNHEKAFLADPSVGPFKETVMLMDDFSIPPMQIDIQKVIGKAPLNWIGPFAPLSTEAQNFLKESGIDIGMIDGLVRDHLSINMSVQSFFRPQTVHDHQLDENFHC